MRKPAWRVLAIDALLVGLACAVPQLHVVAPWAVKLNPMLVLLLAGMLLVPGLWSALLLSVAMPLFSMAVTGLPTPMVAVSMAAELSTVALLFTWTRNMAWLRERPFAGMLAAMLVGKVVYYAVKALLLGSVTALVGTPLLLQLLLAVAYAGLFVMLKNKIVQK